MVSGAIGFSPSNVLRWMQGIVCLLSGLESEIQPQRVIEKYDYYLKLVGRKATVHTLLLSVGCFNAH